MIPVEQLRIYNHVLYKGMPTQIIGINPPSPQKQKHLSDKWLVSIFPAESIWVAIDDIEPIPLTEDMLKDSCGFINVKANYGAVYEKVKGFTIYRFCIREDLDNNSCGVMGIYYPKDEEVLAPTNDNPYNKITLGESLTNFCWGVKHLHHLQNLYYDLEKEQLTVKL